MLELDLEMIWNNEKLLSKFENNTSTIKENRIIPWVNGQQLIKIVFSISIHRLVTLSILAVQLSNWIVEYIETMGRNEITGNGIPWNRLNLS